MLSKNSPLQRGKHYKCKTITSCVAEFKENKGFKQKSFFASLLLKSLNAFGERKAAILHDPVLSLKNHKPDE